MIYRSKLDQQQEDWLFLLVSSSYSLFLFPDQIDKAPKRAFVYIFLGKAGEFYFWRYILWLWLMLGQDQQNEKEKNWPKNKKKNLKGMIQRGVRTAWDQTPGAGV